MGPGGWPERGYRGTKPLQGLWACDLPYTPHPNIHELERIVCRLADILLKIPEGDRRSATGDEEPVASDHNSFKMVTTEGHLLVGCEKVPAIKEIFIVLSHMK